MRWFPPWLRKILMVLFLYLPLPEKIKGNIGTREEYFEHYFGPNQVGVDLSEYVVKRNFLGFSDASISTPEGCVQWLINAFIFSPSAWPFVQLCDYIIEKIR